MEGKLKWSSNLQRQYRVVQKPVRVMTGSPITAAAKQADRSRCRRIGRAGTRGGALSLREESV